MSLDSPENINRIKNLEQSIRAKVSQDETHTDQPSGEIRENVQKKVDESTGQAFEILKESMEEYDYDERE